MYAEHPQAVAGPAYIFCIHFCNWCCSAVMEGSMMIKAINASLPTTEQRGMDYRTYLVRNISCTGCYIAALVRWALSLNSTSIAVLCWRCLLVYFCMYYYLFNQVSATGDLLIGVEESGQCRGGGPGIRQSKEELVTKRIGRPSCVPRHQRLYWRFTVIVWRVRIMCVKTCTKKTLCH